MEPDRQDEPSLSGEKIPTETETAPEPGLRIVTPALDAAEKSTHEPSVVASNHATIPAVPEPIPEPLDKPAADSRPIIAYKDTRSDLAFGSICIVLGFIGLKFLFDPRLDDWLSRQSAQDGVAELTRLDGGVRKHGLNSIAWLDVKTSGMKIDEGDKVFTDGDGRAQISVGGKPVAQILPNSLVVVKLQPTHDGAKGFQEKLSSLFAKRDAQPLLSMEKGRLQLTLDKNGPGVVVSANGKSYELKGAADGGNIEVSLDENNSKNPLRIRGAGANKLLVDEKKMAFLPPKPLDVALLSPAKGTKLQLSHKKERLPVKFDWSQQDSDEVKPLIAELRTKKTGSTDRFDLSEISDDRSFALKLEPGDYTWRIVEKNGARTTGWNDFAIAKLPPPPPPEPMAIKTYDAKVITGRASDAPLNSVPVALRWEPVKNAESYEVTVSDKQGKVVLKKSVDTNELKYRMKKIEALEYRFQVKAKTPDAPAQSRAPASIRIALSAPTSRMPEPNSVVSQGQSIYLTWQKTALTKNYEVQISSSRDFSRVVASSRGHRNFFYLMKPSAGEYFWRARSLSELGVASPWGEARAFKVVEKRAPAQNPKPKLKETDR